MDENKKEISLNVFSSFIFLTNAVLAYYYTYNIYSLLFIGLFTTSVINHYYQTVLTNIIDKISVLLVVGYGYNIFIEKSFNNEYTLSYYICIPLVILTFLSTVYLYCYGYICKEFCFCPDILTQQYYHIFMHFMASSGHHIIMLM